MEHPNRRLSSAGALDVNAFDAEGNLRVTGLASGARRDSVAHMGDLSLSLTEAKRGAFSRNQLLTLVTLCLVNFCQAACYSLLAPFYPKVAVSKGVSGTVIGLIFGVFELVIFMTSPFFGTYITQIGSRFMLVMGIFVSGVCAILFGFLDTSPNGAVYIAMSFLVRIVQALGCSALMTSSFAIVANTFPTRVATMFGTLETFNGLGLMTGPVVGGGLYEVGGFKLPFLVTGGLLLGAAITSVFILPDQNDTAQVRGSGSVLSLLRIPEIAVVAMAIVLSSTTLGFMEPTLAQHLDQFHLSTALVGVMFLVASGLYAASAPIWGFIGDRFGRTRCVIVFGNFGVGVAYFLLGPCPLVQKETHLWLVIVSLVILGVSIGAALVPTLQDTLESAMSHGYQDNFETYGFVSGIFSACFSLGAFIGPIGGGAMVERLGFKWASAILGLVVAGFAVFMCVFYAIHTACRRHSQPYGSTASLNDDDSDDLTPRSPLLRSHSAVVS